MLPNLLVEAPDERRRLWRGRLLTSRDFVTGPKLKSLRLVTSALRLRNNPDPGLRDEPVVTHPASGVAVNSKALMRILLQQKETGLYFKDVGAWTRASREAMDFVSSTAAIDFCGLNKLSGIQLVLKFDEQKYDIVLPLIRPPGVSNSQSSEF